jgi:hypothetical protein
MTAKSNVSPLGRSNSGAQPGGLKSGLKRLVPADWQALAHGVSRLRWITKYRLARSFDADVGLARLLAYVVLDPELESYSFELDDESEVIGALAVALGVTEDELAGYAAETHRDPELNGLLARHVRWRFDAKRRMPLGSRVAWYLTVRALKPELVVETGIYMGLGSLALLRALQLNSQEGHPGELMSFDYSSRAGSLVRGELRQGWLRFHGPTSETLLGALEGRRVNLLFQDTPHTVENQSFEFEAALSNAAARLMLVDCSGGHSPVLADLCRERGGSYHHTPIRSRDHVHPGGEFSFALFSNAGPEPS